MHWLRSGAKGHAPPQEGTAAEGTTTQLYNYATRSAARPCAESATELNHALSLARIGEELASYGAEFKGYERPKKWALAHEEFSPANDMLTPTLKLKRRNVMAAYEATIEALYE